ncbi:hypothetical protein HID58_045341 [Brassica napus]|uniref:Uncharacterized protein n=1 Tax=Brassica napus TaxID=3708 RepID=A0ABQ8ATH1_BRANA|nr:hypothetical protein HID58_045341 [Brassica napus]
MHVLQVGGLSGNIKRILDCLRFPSSPSPSIIAAPLAANASGNCLTSLPCNLKVDVLYFGLICKEVAKVVPAQTLAASNLADQELTETMQKLLIVMQRLDDKIGLILESDGELFNKRYADIYTSRVSNFLNYTPFMYFRSQEQVEKLGRVPLINCAKTRMSSKLISGDSDFFANLVVDAVLSVKMTNQRGEIKYSIKGINILKAHGQRTRVSYLLKGYALNTGSAAQGCH